MGGFSQELSSGRREQAELGTLGTVCIYRASSATARTAGQAHVIWLLASFDAYDLLAGRGLEPDDVTRILAETAEGALLAPPIGFYPQ